MKQKHANIAKGLTVGLLSIWACLSAACSDNEYAKEITGIEGARVYINEGNTAGLTNCLGSMELIHYPAGTLGEEQTFTASVFVSGNAPCDVKATLIYDAALVEEYNQANGTQYGKLPEEVIPEMGLWVEPTEESEGSIDGSSTTLTIPQGQNKSDRRLAIRIPSASFPLLTEESYLVPVRISAVEGARLTASKGLDRMYVVIKTATDTNMAYSASSMNEAEGSSIEDKSGWSVTLDTTGEYEEADLAKIIDGNTWTRFSSNGAREAVFTIDMGQNHPVTGVQIYGSYGQLIPAEFDMSYSTDGSSFSKIGSFEDSVMTQCYIMYAPVEARFIRLSVHAWIGDNIGFTEINVYAK